MAPQSTLRWRLSGALGFGAVLLPSSSATLSCRQSPIKTRCGSHTRPGPADWWFRPVLGIPRRPGIGDAPRWRRKEVARRPVVHVNLGRTSSLTSISQALMGGLSIPTAIPRVRDGPCSLTETPSQAGLQNRNARFDSSVPRYRNAQEIGALALSRAVLGLGRPELRARAAAPVGRLLRLELLGVAASRYRDRAGSTVQGGACVIAKHRAPENAMATGADHEQICAQLLRLLVETLARRLRGDADELRHFVAVHMDKRQLPLGIHQLRGQRNRIAAGGPPIHSHQYVVERHDGAT